MLLSSCSELRSKLSTCENVLQSWFQLHPLLPDVVDRDRALRVDLQPTKIKVLLSN